MTNITLRPGDYVRTKGMTEDQYHAVAKAFMEAGAGQGEYACDTKRGEYALLGWGAASGKICHWNKPDSFGGAGNELTIEQILGAEPDADGWIEWHGGECPVKRGTIIDTKLRCGLQTDGTARGKSGARLWGHNGLDSDIIAYRIHQPEQEEQPAMTIEQLLTKANKHAAKAAKHEAKREALIEQAKDLMPEGWMLEECELVKHPDADWWHGNEDMTDPANWKAGDVVEYYGSSILPDGTKCTLVTVYQDEDAARVQVRPENTTGRLFNLASRFRWISRPASEGGE